jgi:UDP-N-acetylmuramoyl-L-alanyl-D-glutamate--2,6-diaminopimelate ligase
MSAPQTAVSLTWLLEGIATPPANDALIHDLTLDSRAAREGSLFLALPGRHSHGLRFAADAAARGARAVLWDPAEQPAADAGATAALAGNAAFAALPVAGLRRLVGRIADRFFGSPSAHLRVVGVTGTNGKTTCAYLLAQCLVRLGFDAAYLGTLGWGRVGALETPTHTTPDVVNVHRQLSMLRAGGVRDVAMEVSSHALDQGRVDGVRFHTAAFTNLTRDHLDYHASMAEYGAAKARLFDVAGLRQRVIHVGDAFGRELALRGGNAVPLTVVWVGAGEPGVDGARVLNADQLTLDLRGLSMTLDGSFGTRRLSSKLLGRFNAENAVIVIACLTAQGVPLEEAATAFAASTAPPGRMEVIEPVGGGKPLAVIDYAHTPDALAKALRALREHCRGALWCVFGCGGDRDPGKRPLMGAIADELADRIIVTDDNPRGEDPQSICQAILAGIRSPGVRVIHDRGAAIAAALNEAAPADMVLIAGKGHEDYQIYGAARRSFSDRHEAMRYLGAVA